MFLNKNEVSEEYFDLYGIEEFDYNDKSFDGVKVSEESTQLANNLFSMFQDMINKEESLTEEFTSKENGAWHFNRHCMPNSIRGRKSTRSKVYYDFTELKDYLSYEDSISRKTIKARDNEKMFIQDLEDTEKVLEAFWKLFEGGQTLVFSLSCGFTNESGNVRICIHSWATDVTNNYLNNTVDFMIQSSNDKTITIYPIDANYLENKINNEINKIEKFKGMQLKINH